MPTFVMLMNLIAKGLADLKSARAPGRISGRRRRVTALP